MVLCCLGLDLKLLGLLLGGQAALLRFHWNHLLPMGLESLLQARFQMVERSMEGHRYLDQLSLLVLSLLLWKCHRLELDRSIQVTSPHWGRPLEQQLQDSPLAAAYRL